MPFQNGSAAFAPIAGRGPQVLLTTVTFPSAVRKATALLTGFIAEFSAHQDHHLGLLDIQVSVPRGGVKGNNVEVRAVLGLRDWSGDWDDMYDGEIFFTVIAE